MTEIIDSCDALLHMKKYTQSDANMEHGAFAIAKIIGEDRIELFDFCDMEEVGARFFDDKIVIPSKSSYILIKLCSDYGYIPVVIHSHLQSLSKNGELLFSHQDIVYLDKLANLAGKLGSVNKVVSILTDGIITIHCIMDVKTGECMYDNKYFTNIAKEIAE